MGFLFASVLWLLLDLPRLKGQIVGYMRIIITAIVTVSAEISFGLEVSLRWNFTKGSRWWDVALLTEKAIGGKKGEGNRGKKGRKISRIQLGVMILWWIDNWKGNGVLLCIFLERGVVMEWYLTTDGITESVNKSIREILNNYYNVVVSRWSYKKKIL